MNFIPLSFTLVHARDEHSKLTPIKFSDSITYSNSSMYKGVLIVHYSGTYSSNISIHSRFIFVVMRYFVIYFRFQMSLVVVELLKITPCFSQRPRELKTNVKSTRLLPEQVISCYRYL